MELSGFRQEREAIESGILPYKIVRLDEVKQVENNVFTIGDTDVELTAHAQKVLNRAVGTTAEQLKMVKKCSGDSGQANFRNYLSVAKTMSEEKQVVLIADPESKKISNVIIPKEDFIPAGAFFDFAEMFVDSTDTRVEKIERSLHGNMDVRIFLQPSQPDVQSFHKGEDFITNGLYLHWNGASIELGSYFLRLVCLNGATVRSQRRENILYTLAPETAEKMIKIACDHDVRQYTFERFRVNALEAMRTTVSLKELRVVYGMLKGHGMMLPEEIASAVVPYNGYLEHFEKMGVDVKQKMNLVKTDINWWELYNRLTRFATHNTFMKPNDIARSHINTVAAELLYDNHDIKNYIEYV